MGQAASEHDEFFNQDEDMYDKRLQQSMNQKHGDSPTADVQYGDADDDDDKSSPSMGSLDDEDAEQEPDGASMEDSAHNQGKSSKPGTGGKSRQRSKRQKSRSVRQKSKKNNLVSRRLGNVEEEFEEDESSRKDHPSTIEVPETRQSNNFYQDRLEGKVDSSKYREELEKFDPQHVADLMYAKKERKIPNSVLRPHNPYVQLVQSNTLKCAKKNVRVFFPYPLYCYKI